MFHLNTKIKKGSHRLPSEGSCTMEIATLAAGHDWREVKSAEDLPECMCRVIGAYVITLNDAMPDDERQRLMAFVPRLTMTRGTLQDEINRAEYLVWNAAKPALLSSLHSAGLPSDNVTQAENLLDFETAAAAAAYAAARVHARAAAYATRAYAAAYAAADAAGAAAAAAAAAGAAAAAAYAAGAAAAAADAAFVSSFDWQPYLSVLDGALKIGPQAPEIEANLIRSRVKILEGTA